MPKCFTRKHKDVPPTLSQGPGIRFIDVVCTSEIDVSQTSVDKVVITLQSDVAVMLWQRSTNVMLGRLSKLF